MSAQALLFWLVVNVVCAVFSGFQLRDGQTEDRGWYGFWLAMSGHTVYTLSTKLLALAA